MAPATTVLYARNLFNFVQLLVDPKGQELKIDTEDDLVKGTLLTRDGPSSTTRSSPRPERGTRWKRSTPASST